MEKFETYILESNPKYDKKMRLIYGIGGILYISLVILIIIT